MNRTNVIQKKIAVFGLKLITLKCKFLWTYYTFRLRLNYTFDCLNQVFIKKSLSFKRAFDLIISRWLDSGWLL